MAGWADCMAGFGIGGALLGVHYAVRRIRDSRIANPNRKAR
jgi:hypothetical protein